MDNFLGVSGWTEMSFAEEEQKQERKTVSSIPEKVLTTVLNGEQEGEKRYVGKDF